MSSEENNRQPKALIAMSGGVDSSVAAALMQEMGYDCVGAMMKLYQREDIAVSEGTAKEKSGGSRKVRCQKTGSAAWRGKHW